MGSERAFGRRNAARRTWINLASDAQRTGEGLEHGLGLMVGIVTSQCINMHRDSGMIDQALEEFVHQVNIEFANHCASERHIEDQAGTSGKIDHDARQGFIQGHIGVTIATQALLVTPSLRQRLTYRYADILYRVVRIDMQIADGGNLKINQSMTGKLVEHVVKKSYAGIQLGYATAIEVEHHPDFGFQRVARDIGLPHFVSWCR